MKEKAIQRARQGFTMMEVLLVVGILAVVTALAAPNVIEAQRSLRMTELDAKAEQIYNAAQYQLSALKAAGRLGVFETDAASSDVLTLPLTPADYVLSGAGAEEALTVDTLRFTTSAAATAKNYILSTDTAGVTNGVTNGDYAIEFSPFTGEVYAVFYWESDAVSADGTLPSAPEAYYRQVCAYRSNAAGIAYRTDHRIGYYNGGGVSVAKDDPDSPGTDLKPFNLSSLSLDLLNEEELYIKIYNPDGSLADTDFDPSKLKLTVFMQELDNSHVKGSDGYWENPSKRVLVNVNGGVVRNDLPTVPSGNVIDGGALSFDKGFDSEIDYILDSLYEDASGNPMSFARLTGGKISSGSNVAITVYAQYEDQNWVKGPKEVNSSFGDFIIDQDGGKGTIEVSSVRHLANIATTPIDGGGSSTIKYMEIALTEDINFDGTQWESDSVATNAHRIRENRNPWYEGGSYEPMAPIVLPDYFNSGNDRTIDGGGHKLVGFVIGDPDNPQDRTGLFSYLKANIKDIELVDPIVNGRADTGALVAYVDNAGLAFENCKVTGGTVNGTTRVGGLVGASRVSTFKNCSSTADVSATGNCVGGFVGAEENSMFEGCTVGSVAYAGSATSVSSSGSNVGGFVGAVDVTQDGQQWPNPGGKIVDCTVYAKVSGLDYVGGFAGYVRTGLWGSGPKNCGALASYDANLNPVIQTASGRNYVGGFVGHLGGVNDFESNTAQMNVTASGDYAGGFAGNLEHVTAKKCLAQRVDDSHVPVVTCAGSNVDAFGKLGQGASTSECDATTVRVNK